MKTFKFISGLIFTLLFFNTHLFSQANFWEPTNGPVGKRIWAMAIAPNGYIYSGTDVEGVYLSTDGMNWTQKISGLNNLAIRTLAVKPDGKVFAGTDGGIYLSINNGDSWTSVNTGLTNVDIRAIGVAPNGDVFVGTWGGGVFKSTDNGTSWVAGNQDLYNTYIRSICVNSSGTIFVGTSGGGVYRSSDGNQWTTPSNYGNINVIALSLNTSGNIFAGTSGNGVFRSTNGGSSWTPVNNGLTDMYLRTLIVNPADNYVYAGTYYQGVYRSTDNGGTWFKISSGLKITDVLSMGVSSTGRLYAGSNGDGVYRNIIYIYPILATDVDTIYFSATKGAALPQSKTIAVSNLGAGTMSWTTAKGATWLNTTIPTNDTNNDTINVSVNTTAMAAGTHTSDITITAPTAGNDNFGKPSSPKKVIVIYTIYAPTINVVNSINFGNVDSSKYKDTIITISNTGNAPLTISAITKSGNDPTMFSTTSTAPITIAAGAKYSMTIRFLPTSTGSKSAVLTLTNNDVTAIINLTGIGVVPKIDAQPSPVDFKTVNVSSSKDTIITITNSGGATLIISDISLTGSDFSFPNGEKTLSVSAGGSYKLTVRFTPSSAGAKTGSLNLTHNAVSILTLIPLSGTGALPLIDVNPVKLSFGQVNVGSYNEMTVTITNSGSGPLIITGISTIGTDANQFGRYSSPDSVNKFITIDGGKSYTIKVRFSPTTVGSKTATLNIAHNASGGNTAIPLDGTGIKSGISITPSPMDFGNVDLGSNKDMQLVIKNTGSADLSITDIQKSGTNSAQFTFANPTFPLTLKPNDSISITIKFTPLIIGTNSANLSIYNNASGTPSAVTLTGNGTGKAVIYYAPSLDFGNVSVNSTKSMSVLIRNDGNDTLRITNSQMSGTDVSLFYLQGSSIPVNLAPGSSINLLVTYLPTSKGNNSATLILNHNAAGSPATINLKGNGVESGFLVNPSPLDFGKVDIGKNKDLTLTLLNTGNVDLTISSITVNGTNFTLFSRYSVIDSSKIPITLIGGQSYSIIVRFVPDSLGQKSANLSIVHTAAGSPTNVPLSGEGIGSAVLVFNPASVSFGNVKINDSLDKTVEISNTGNLDLRIDSSTIIGTDYTNFSLPFLKFPLTINTNSKYILTIRFSPQSLGNKTATVKLFHNAPGLPFTVDLSGVGVLGNLANPTSIDFGNVNTSSQKDTTVEISNTGTAPLVITKIFTSGSPYTITAVTLPRTLNPGEKFPPITVSFKPSSTGTKSDSITIEHNAPGTPSIVLLTGKGVSVGISVTQKLNFDSVLVGKSKDLTFVIQNIGTAPLIITSLSKSGTDVSMFNRFSSPDSSSIQITLNPGMSYFVTVRFSPTSTGYKSAILSVNNNAGAPVEVALLGVGISPEISVIPIPPTPVNFGNVNLNIQKNQTIDITNTGSAPLILTNITVSGTEFSLVTGSLPDTLNPNEKVTITASFKPVSIGNKTGSISIFHNATGSPTLIPLLGQSAVVNCLIARTYQAKPGQTIIIPVEAVDDLTGKSAGSYNFVLLYKKTILSPKSVSVTGTLSEGFTATIDPIKSKPGELNISVISPNSTTFLTKNGKLLNIEFTALLGDSCGSPLNFQSFTFENGPQVTKQDGLFTLIGRCGGEKSYASAITNTLLMQNSPNPVSMDGGTDIRYQILNAEHVKITIYDLLGREVSRLVDQEKAAGLYNIHFDTRGLPAGVYFYRMQTKSFNEIKRMHVIR